MARQRQRGAHRYFGKFNSRGKRSLSKLHRGIESGNVEAAFEQLEREKLGHAVSNMPNTRVS